GLSSQARCVTIDWLAALVGGGDLGEAFGIAVQDAGKVHHFAEVANARVVEQLLDLCHRDGRAGRFKRGRRHTGRGAEIELEWRPGGVVEHVAHAGDAQHITDLVRVAYRRNGAVDDGRASELAWHEHGAFNVHVGVDKAGQQEREFATVFFWLGDGFDSSDAA